MMVSERDAGDLRRLQELADQERDALRRDRFRAVRLALQGKETLDIADRLDRSRRSVQDWVYAYRDGGIDAIQPKPQPGRKPKLPREREAELGRIKGDANHYPAFPFNPRFFRQPRGRPRGRSV